MADLIRPGWVLDMPDDAVNTTSSPPTSPGPQPSTPTTAAQPSGGETQTVEPGPDDRKSDARPRRKARAGRGPTSDAPRSSGRATPGPREQLAEQDRQRAEQEALAAQESGLELGDYLAGTSLAAAGLLAVLGRRRREQLLAQVVRASVARPREDAAKVEVALRLGADAPGTRMLDVGLRLLGRALAARPHPADRLRRAPVGPEPRPVDPPAGPDAPAPWTAHDGGRVWRLAAHEGRALDEQG